MATKRCADADPPASPQSQKRIAPGVANPLPEPPLPYMPDGLILEILARLPGKSVIRFKCVCKAWLAMISSRHFIHAQLELSKMRPAIMLIVPGEYSYRLDGLRLEKTAFRMRFYRYNNNSTSSIAELVHSEQFPSGIAHCDGLILTSTRDQEIIICNPLTRESILLPKGSHSNSKHHRVGFGFDPCSNKYKVVRFFSQREEGTSKSVCRFEVLTLGSNVWRRTADPPYPILGVVTPAHVRGFIYWRVDLPLEMEDPEVLVRFDLAKETFSLIPYPPCDRRPFSLIELQGELCCACFSDPSEFVEIWTCGNTDVPTWTRLCTFMLPQETIVSLPEGLFRIPRVTFHGKDLLIIGDRKMYRYCIGTGRMKKVAVAVEDLWYYHPGSNKYHTYLGNVAFETVNYAESLVRISGYT